MSKRSWREFFRESWERLGFGSARPPRVADDDGEDDGLAGSRVPRKPIAPRLSGGAAVATLVRDRVEEEG